MKNGATNFYSVHQDPETMAENVKTVLVADDENQRIRMLSADLQDVSTLAIDGVGGASAFVLSSRVESFAIVLLEAGALGTPVIATDICGVGELIEDGLHGALVPSENPEALAARILELHDRPDRLRNLGHRLRDHVASEFRWSTAASRYLDLVGTARPR